MKKIFDDIEKKKIFCSEGYSQKMNLSDLELKELRKLVEDQYYSIVEENYPDQLATFKKRGLENYHELSRNIDHCATWPKKTRCLEQQSCEIRKCQTYKSHSFLDAKVHNRVGLRLAVCFLLARN